MPKKTKINLFPLEAELEKICEEMSNPNYSRVNVALSPDATPLEISKYSLCKKILTYKQQKNLSAEKLAQKINLTIPETEDILFARINKFTLDRLVAYANNLFPFHLAVQEEQPKKILKSSVKSKENISVPSHNNSKSKSIHLRRK